MKLGSLTPQLAGLVGLDFETINASLRTQGSPEVDLILGADVFDAHAAIIDYPSRPLFLRPVVERDPGSR